MRTRNSDLYSTLDDQLTKFNRNKFSLPGITSPSVRDVFIRQLIDSVRRVSYVFAIGDRDVGNNRADPLTNDFDPLKASLLFKRKGMIDEAFWLAFLTIHFGKALRTGWRLIRDIYGALGANYNWTWERTSSSPKNFVIWLQENYNVLKGDGVPRHFGNHRKYETLKPEASRSTGLVIASYVNWIGPLRKHEILIQQTTDKVGNDPRAMFDHLYKSMNQVVSFGRTARFDYLTMLAKLGLAQIEPGSTYMQGSTGPAKGARLLFFGHIKADITCKALENQLHILEDELSVGKIGMQVLEDALCNWQKKPNKYTHFSG